MFSRRDFLRLSSLVTLVPTVPAFLARTARATEPQRDGRVLVVIELQGGNDGINTVVPYRDEGYARNRRRLRLPVKELVRINDQLGFHPALGDFGTLLESGRLAVVQGVGYPNPSRSHFQSMATWHTARLDPAEHGNFGWLGRALDVQGQSTRDPAALLVGAGQPPLAIRGRRAAAAAIQRPADFLLNPAAGPRTVLGPERAGDDLTAFVRRSMVDAYAAADRFAEISRRRNADRIYPGALGEQLQLIARLLKAGYGTRIYYAMQGTYDTHASQPLVHANLLAGLGAAVKAFVEDLAEAHLSERVLVLCFSEFGRTVAENLSEGTDHGTAGPVFLAGGGLRSGLIGTTPSLSDLDPVHGDLRVGIDFRRVYATILADWLGLPAQAALAGHFERLPLFRA